MAQGVKLDFGSASVLDAWRDGGERAAVSAAIEKYAATIDSSDSARDMKPLITGMFEAIDRLKDIDAQAAACDGDTPLARILRMESRSA